MGNDKRFVKQDESNTNIYIYGEIRKKDFWDMVFGDEETRTGAFDFKEALEQVDTPKLTVRINSLGGSVSEGLAIYNLLNDFAGEVTTVIDGFACSAASVIFMAGSKRIAPESSLLMIHNAWARIEGDHNDMTKAAEDLRQITQPSVNIYVSKTGLSENEIKEKMDRETWITSQEAFDLGFATMIEKQEAQQSLSDRYLHKLIMKIKQLENPVESTEQKSSWDGFFNA